MRQEDINDLLHKSPESKITAYREGYSKAFIIKTVKNLFHKYASNSTHDAINDLYIILDGSQR